VLGSRAEAGGDQERAELVTVQRGGVRLVIQPGTADVRCRGVHEDLLFHGVLVEPGDGAQPPCHGGAGAAAGLQFAGEGLDVGAADGEQGQGPGAAPAGELAKVESVGLAGQAAVPGQEPGEREPLSIGEGRLDGGEGTGLGRGGHRATSGTAETRRAGPASGPSSESGPGRKPRPRAAPEHEAHKDGQPPGRVDTAGNAPIMPGERDTCPHQSGCPAMTGRSTAPAPGRMEDPGER
jgi:hypothetical protein